MARTKQSGFTIIELMFSTVIFSIVLLLCLSALIQIGRMYYKGVTTSQTQNAARAVMDELSQGIQLSPKTIRTQTYSRGPEVAADADPDKATDFVCIGQIKYSFAMDRQLRKASPDYTKKELRHVLWVSEDPDCLDRMTDDVDLTAENPTTEGRELLGENMRLVRFQINTVPGSDDSVRQIDVSVAYGDDEFLKTMSYTKHCDGPQIGTQFCAVSDLSTIVKRRVL